MATACVYMATACIYLETEKYLTVHVHTHRQVAKFIVAGASVMNGKPYCVCVSGSYNNNSKHYKNFTIYVSIFNIMLHMAL